MTQQIQSDIINDQLLDGWVETTLGNVMFPVSETFDMKNISKIHFLNTWDILDWKLLHNNLSDVSWLPWQAKKKFRKWDILYSEIRPENRRYMFVDFDSSNSVASTKLMVLRNKENIDALFLYIYITSDKVINEFQVIAESRSWTFPQITFDSISHFSILLPPLPEQIAIASVISSFDDKIELLREENKTLEQTAQTIFQEWFGKYGVDDELPEGWRVGKLGEVCEITSGKRPDNTSNNKTEQYQIPLIGASKIMWYVESYLFDWKTIVIWRVGTHWEIQKYNEKIYPSDNTLVLKSDNFVFAYQILKNIDYEKMNRGAVQPLITQTDMKNYPIIIPSEKVFLEFQNITNSIFEKIENNEIQIQSLSKTRDELLPRLMKGEVRVNF